VNEYYAWLCDIINVNQSDRTYWFLAKTLHRKDYYWSVPNDDNRGMDGLRLREEFAEEWINNSIDSYGWVRGVLDRPCSMLEMLIGLSRRMVDILVEPGEKDQTERCFWELMENLGLDKYTDDEYFELRGTPRVNHIIDVVLDRSYKRNGKGGLFPLRIAKKDQRKIEIWYQMCAYLLENYYVKEENM